MPSREKDSKHYQHVQQNYNRLSGIYDLISGNAELKILQSAIHKLKERKIEKLLDIGCGTGKALSEYGKLFLQETWITGIDLSFEMCRKAKDQNIRVVCSNGVFLPFQKSTFDAITFNFSIEIFPEDGISQVLGECDRVLQPGGLICAVHMLLAPKKNVMSDLYLWSHKNLPNVIDCRPMVLSALLSENRFEIIENKTHFLWGLPVQIILARKDH
jgi:ubiquinone/menaquinone biosynthesis C-methylase UbiE